jgi:outer membrane protein OmpA-like peptidoglycan-associated protein
MRILIRGRVLLVGACILAGSVLWAQQSQKPVAPAAVSTDLAVTFAVEHSQVVPGQSKFWFKGGGADAAVTFWKGLGLAAAITGDHASNVSPGVDANKLSYLGGPRYTWTAWKGTADQRRLQVFGQGLFGEAHGFDGLYPATGGATFSANSFAVQAGGGLNLYLTRNWGVRLLEADYVRTTLPNASANAQNDMRLAFGLTYHIESAAPPPVTLACTATPTSVYPGDPVTVTATAGGLNPKLNAVYSWSGAGVTGTGTTATVATGSLTAGSYTVHCGVKEGKPGKEGLKPWESAEATAVFNVKAFEPPTISCSASPTTIKPGETSAITASGVSPQNRPLTYTYSATAGSVSSAGANAIYSSTGAPTGAVGITCTVSDDKGQTATANTSVTIAAPYVPPMPHTQALCSISFATDKKRPERVDNEAKACLDEIALDLQKQPDAKAVVVGNSDAKEKAKLAKEQKAALKNKHLKVTDPAAERAVNAKDYLVTEKGIDASRVSVATGTADGQTAQDYMVPSGAGFTADVTGTTPVDETAVKAQPRKPLPAKAATKKQPLKPVSSVKPPQPAAAKTTKP